MSTFGIAGVLDFGRRSWAVARIACRLRRFAGRVLVARMERSPYHRDRSSRTRDRPTRRRRRPWLPEIKGCGALTAATFALSRAAVALWRRFGSDNIAVPRVATAKRTNAVAWVAVAGGPLNYSSRSGWVQEARARSRSRGQVGWRPATRRLWVLLVICSSRSGPLRDWVTRCGRSCQVANCCGGFKSVAHIATSAGHSKITGRSGRDARLWRGACPQRRAARRWSAATR